VQPARRGASGKVARQQHVPKEIERTLVPEEERLVGRHRLDDSFLEVGVAPAFESGHQRRKIIEFVTATYGAETAFDEVTLLRG
jgi:hypothetical protein